MQHNLSLASATLVPLAGLIPVTHCERTLQSEPAKVVTVAIRDFKFEPPMVTVHEDGTGEGKNADKVLQKLLQMANPKSRLSRQHLFHLCMTVEVIVQ